MCCADSIQAPEVYGEHSDYSCTDVFALGMIMYEIVTGKRPYAGLRNDQVLAKILSGKPPADITVLPEQYRDLVTRCWARSL